MELPEKESQLVISSQIRMLNDNDKIPYNLLLDADPSKKLVDSYLSSGETYLTVIENETIGVCVLVTVNSETIEIKNLAVAENMRGQGIGTRMIKNSFQIAKQKGYKTILIATSTPNIGPLYLYQKMGFEYDYLVKHYFDSNINNYNEPLFDHGIKCNHLIVLSKRL
ncbi:GNAT family N-acetyltransferase [Dyadobacter fanqingshengii]|uniref:GNAT family N-acetyltransferase n=1 Tax=Dyadobacter fanqingshengii TaxID=2906443 RepID=A0A9X1PDG6_9BACT|nr:GNAT family N-acetyltransferase [Dyadobacter fanqingshengii]MCF0042134.1 GNAT family N-acetyltransferase [Dyadobacter fanqingshengii]USJ35332.1 GNAT family N-acetyltransferase [Dyadobacter fanqingshengii]